MFHNIDPTLALAAVSFAVLLVVAFVSVTIADTLAMNFNDEDADTDIEAVARATGMIDTNQYN